MIKRVDKYSPQEASIELKKSNIKMISSQIQLLFLQQINFLEIIF